MHSDELRTLFLNFFESKGHTIVTSSSLVPQNDPTVLFTTAGMQQFKQYYGAPQDAIKDFNNNNITSCQKCVRTGDIDDVGDDTHLTFFEMLGNFSFGGYGRKEAIVYAHEFITKELGLTISYVTYYKGEGMVLEDIESRDLWQSLGITDIRQEGSDVFWGPTGLSGPCGPTTEIYCKNAHGDDVEIWNIVFNEYMCKGTREALDKGEAQLVKAETLGIDTGMGFERLLATVQHKKNVYDTDIFVDTIDFLKEQITIGNKNKSRNIDEKFLRIIADHIRTAMFIISDGVVPDNKDRGYILRRLIRRAMVRAQHYGLEKNTLLLIIDMFLEKYTPTYPRLKEVKIREIIAEEYEHFQKTLEQGMKEFKKGCDAFTLATTYGFPIEMTKELAEESGMKVDIDDYEKKMSEHQLLSRTASAGIFKGGLANHNEQTIRLHTAHHLLLAALQSVLGSHVKQKGSNITEERLRIDFSFERKLTNEEKHEIEAFVNNAIHNDYMVIQREMRREDAEKIGAEMEFGAKYPETVSVYFIEDKNGNSISKEFCGGPHVVSTKSIGTFKILKEEASSSGVRRIKGTVLY